MTMYDENYFFVANPLNRYSISARQNLKANPDGSVDLYIQNEVARRDKESNWLPAPKGKSSSRCCAPTGRTQAAVDHRRIVEDTGGEGSSQYQGERSCDRSAFVSRRSPMTGRASLGAGVSGKGSARQQAGDGFVGRGDGPKAGRGGGKIAIGPGRSLVGLGGLCDGECADGPGRTFQRMGEIGAPSGRPASSGPAAVPRSGWTGGRTGGAVRPRGRVRRRSAWRGGPGRSAGLRPEPPERNARPVRREHAQSGPIQPPSSYPAKWVGAEPRHRRFKPLSKGLNLAVSRQCWFNMVNRALTTFGSCDRPTVSIRSSEE